MRRTSWLRRSLIVPLVFLSSRHVSADIHEHDGDEDLFSFVSRPDIRAPRWKVNITDESALSPGYWFTAPFQFIDQHEPGNGYVGPHIYDGHGELIWSGVAIGEGWDAIDFRMSNVRGNDRLTFQIQREGNGYILDNTLEVKEKVDLGTLGHDFNSHEFYFIDNGMHAISMTEGRRDATEEQSMAVEQDEVCRVLFNGFRVWDTKTWKKVFEWSSFDHVGLEESSFTYRGVKSLCHDDWGWDFIHTNSVDKDQNGDFYVSGRHTDTIYKVSKDDGHIIWKLHGQQKEDGEWDMGDLKFSRQHNVRFRGFDGTHEFISILDNASGDGNDDQKPTHGRSRGLVISLKVNDRTKEARIVSSVEHPYGVGSYAPRRGNYQVLPNDHIFVGWSEQATHSEHAPDGRLLMSASLRTEYLGTYRSYKFPFVGRPSEPPTAVSAAYASKSRNSTTTMVHVSWNGATEIDYWNLYKTTETGDRMVKIFKKKKGGFETALAWDGYASYVIVEAVDKDGKVAGRTNIVKTQAPPNDAMSEAVAEEVYWLQEVSGENDEWTESNSYAESSTARKKPSSSGSFVLFFVFGVIVAAVAGAGVWWYKTKGFPTKFPRYQALDVRDDEGELGERYPKRDQAAFRDSS